MLKAVIPTITDGFDVRAMLCCVCVCVWVSPPPSPFPYFDTFHPLLQLENAALDERLFLFFGNLASVLCVRLGENPQCSLGCVA